MKKKAAGFIIFFVLVSKVSIDSHQLHGSLGIEKCCTEILVSLQIRSMSETNCSAQANLLCTKFVSKFYREPVSGQWNVGSESPLPQK